MGEWTLNNTTLAVKRGNLAEQTTGTITLGVDTDWTPAGPASGAVLSAGGDAVRSRISDLDSAEPGTIQAIDSGDLPCHDIQLVTMVTESRLDDPDEWIRTIYRHLLDAVRTAGHTELALPPLGLGDFDWSIDRTSRAGIETISKFVRDNSHFDQINLIVYDAIEFSSVDNFADDILGEREAEPDAEQRLRDYY